MDEGTLFVLLIAVGAAAYALSQWQIWKRRAIAEHQTVNALKGQVNRSHTILDNLEDERKLQHDAMMESFDFLNDNQPFGSRNEGLMQVKNVLLHAIQNSTYGRGT